MEKQRVFTYGEDGECNRQVAGIVTAASQPPGTGVDISPPPPLARDHLAGLEQMHRCLPPIQDTFARWQRAGRSALSGELALRERLLGPATLSSASLRLLYDISSQFVADLPQRIYWHAPTLSARETQAILPPHVLVQKTVSVEMAGHLVLWTSVGDDEHTLAQRRLVASALGLPRRAARQCSTNPASCRPEQEFGMLPGMVSPFLPPLRPTRLVSVVQVPWPASWEEQGKAVGVSLSLFESLILPLSCLRAVVLQYAARAYAPSIHWMEVSRQDLLPHEQTAERSERNTACLSRYPRTLVRRWAMSRKGAGVHTTSRSCFR